MSAPLFGVLLAFVPASFAAVTPSYATVDAAAIAFVDRVRAYPEQKNEYCAWLVKTPEGRVVIGEISTGDMDRCRGVWPKPEGTVGSAHTHPIWGPNAWDVGAAGQVFSAGDYGHAEHPDVGVPIYLGAPAGHVLRYDPGGSKCWGKSFIAREFKVVRDISPSVLGRLPVEPGVKTPLYDIGGKPIAKPAYCQDAPR